MPRPLESPRPGSCLDEGFENRPNRRLWSPLAFSIIARDDCLKWRLHPEPARKSAQIPWPLARSGVWRAHQMEIGRNDSELRERIRRPQSRWSATCTATLSARFTSDDGDQDGGGLIDMQSRCLLESPVRRPSESAPRPSLCGRARHLPASSPRTS